MPPPVKQEKGTKRSLQIKNPVFRKGNGVGKLLEQALLVELGLAAAAPDGAEALLELVDAAFGVHELVLAGEERVGIGGDTAGNHEMFNPVNNFRLGGTNGGMGDEAASGGDVNENDRIILGMNVFLHGDVLRFRRKGSTSIGAFYCMSSIPV
jgi:hypothetical protein